VSATLHAFCWALEGGFSDQGKPHKSEIHHPYITHAFMGQGARLTETREKNVRYDGFSRHNFANHWNDAELAVENLGTPCLVIII